MAPHPLPFLALSPCRFLDMVGRVKTLGLFRGQTLWREAMKAWGQPRKPAHSYRPLPSLFTSSRFAFGAGGGGGCSGQDEGVVAAGWSLATPSL
jgi:hypothetical protein